MTFISINLKVVGPNKFIVEIIDFNSDRSNLRRDNLSLLKLLDLVISTFPIDIGIYRA